MDVSDRARADRFRRPLRRVAASVEVDDRGPELDEDQPGPHAPRCSHAGRVRRADHQGQHRRGDLCDDFLDCAVAEGCRGDLDRVGRWLRAGDARRREHVEERHAEGSRRIRAHQPGRSVAVPRWHRLRRGQPVSTGRLPAVCVSYRRLRADMDEDRRRHCAERFCARHSRGRQGGEAAVSRDRARHPYLIRRWRELAVAAAESAGHAGARHCRGTARPGHRDARPRLLRHGQHRPAQTGRPPDDEQFPSVQTGRRAARPRSSRGDRLLPEAAGAESDAGISRRAGKRHSHVHRHAAARRRAAPAAAGRRRRRVPASAGSASAGHGRTPASELGHAVSGCDRIPGADHVGGLHAWSPGAARHVPGARHG